MILVLPMFTTSRSKQSTMRTQDIKGITCISRISYSAFFYCLSLYLPWQRKNWRKLNITKLAKADNNFFFFNLHKIISIVFTFVFRLFLLYLSLVLFSHDRRRHFSWFSLFADRDKSSVLSSSSLVLCKCTGCRWRGDT